MKRLIALLLTVIVVGLLLWNVDREKLLHNFASTRWSWFSVAILLFIPQVWMIGWRWRRMVMPFTPLSMVESVKMILASLTMNLVLPSKLGDLTKGVFLYRAGALDLPRAMNVVVFEKMLDVAALSFLMLIGAVGIIARGGVAGAPTSAVVIAALLGLAAMGGVLMLYYVPIERFGLSRLISWMETRGKGRRIAKLISSSHEVMALLQSRGAKRGQIVVSTVIIWLLHLGQIYAFFLSLGVDAPLSQFSSLVPLAIFIGLLPLTIAGFGTRDAAIIQFFPNFAKDLMLGVAMYVNLRYILPAIAGIPFLSKYLAYAKEVKAAQEAV